MDNSWIRYLIERDLNKYCISPTEFKLYLHIFIPNIASNVIKGTRASDSISIFYICKILVAIIKIVIIGFYTINMQLCYIPIKDRQNHKEKTWQIK